MYSNFQLFLSELQIFISSYNICFEGSHNRFPSFIARQWRTEGIQNQGTVDSTLTRRQVGFRPETFYCVQSNAMKSLQRPRNIWKKQIHSTINSSRKTVSLHLVNICSITTSHVRDMCASRAGSCCESASGLWLVIHFVILYKIPIPYKIHTFL